MPVKPRTDRPPVDFGDLEDEKLAEQDRAAGVPRARVSSGGFATPRAGDVFDGRFELVRVLGKGGAGVVWEAVTRDFPSPLAVKIIPVASAIRADRVRREIAIGMRLEGPHFVRVFDAGVTPPFAFVAMEMLHGEDLATRLDRVGRLDRAQVLSLAAQIATGMEAAHAHGFVHRDLKPTNVFLSREGEGERVKILDFGVAKLLLVETRVTTSDTLLGVPQYAAPEQIKNAHSVDTRADVWSVGALLYRCLLGRRPFDGTGGALLTAVIAAPHPRPSALDPTLSPAVDEVFQYALAKDPAQRFQTVTAVHTALEAALRPSAPQR